MSGQQEAPTTPVSTTTPLPTLDNTHRASGAIEAVAAAEDATPSTCGRTPATAAGALVPTARRRPVRRIIGQQVPDEILKNEALNAAVAILPANYNFEVHKTVWRLRQAKARRVALQLPEGLQVWWKGAAAGSMPGGGAAWEQVAAARRCTTLHL